MLHGQGTLRFTNEELTAFKHDIWGTVAGLLQVSKTDAASRGREGDDPFWALGGDQPTEADATLIGFIISVLISTAYVCCLMQKCIMWSCANVVAEVPSLRRW